MFARRAATASCRWPWKISTSAGVVSRSRTSGVMGRVCQAPATRAWAAKSGSAAGRPKW